MSRGFTWLHITETRINCALQSRIRRTRNASEQAIRLCWYDYTQYSLRRRIHA